MSTAVVVPVVSAIVFILVLTFILGGSGRRSRSGGLRAMFDPKLQDPVPGTLTVTDAGIPNRHAQNAATTLIGVLEQAGAAPVPVQGSAMVPTVQWPRPGQRLPVLVERTDPNRFVVLWEAVPTAADVARLEAEELARRQMGRDA